MKGKRRSRAKMVLSIIGIVVLALAVMGGVALVWTEPERREGRNLEIGVVDFATLPDGVYLGEYQGGRFGWRANKVQVTAAGGRVTGIALQQSTEKRPAAFAELLYGRVIEAQSLQVDTISQATITSKAFLKAIEAALAAGRGG